MYWCAARLQPHREALALHCLGHAYGIDAFATAAGSRSVRYGAVPRSGSCAAPSPGTWPSTPT
jgi:hypothetical protein